MNLNLNLRDQPFFTFFYLWAGIFFCSFFITIAEYTGDASPPMEKLNDTSFEWQCTHVTVCPIMKCRVQRNGSFRPPSNWDFSQLYDREENCFINIAEISSWVMKNQGQWNQGQCIATPDNVPRIIIWTRSLAGELTSEFKELLWEHANFLHSNRFFFL